MTPKPNMFTTVISLCLLAASLTITTACRRIHRCQCFLKDEQGTVLDYRELTIERISKKKAEEKCSSIQATDENGNTWSCSLASK